MAIYTQLSPSAIPGKRYSFSAKDPAPAGGPHTGTFTELSVTATPGPIHSFSAKDEAAAPSGPHTGLFTALSVLSLPGQRHTFSAKTEAIAPVIPEPEPAPEIYGGGGGPLQGWPDAKEKEYFRRKRILKEDDELMQIAAAIVASGILD